MVATTDVTFASRGMPRLNEPAPDFEAVTTHGVRKLSDYQGKWLILFSHPSDFTPVCTTEFIAFARAHDKFAALNTELLGLSIDSKYAHIAWVRHQGEIWRRYPLPDHRRPVDARGAHLRYGHARGE